LPPWTEVADDAMDAVAHGSRLQALLDVDNWDEDWGLAGLVQVQLHGEDPG